MSAKTLIFSFETPEASKFIALRQKVGWDSPAPYEVQKSIENTLFWVTAYQQRELIATGRVVGDGAMYFYIQDIIVHPDFQSDGLGTKVMAHIQDYLKKTCSAGATIGLFAAKGKEPFYRKYDFQERTGENLGLGMCRFV